MSNGSKVQKVSWDLIDAGEPQAEEIADSLPPRNGLIGKVLAPALQLWLRSLLDGIEDLQVHISGQVRQILSGEIPSVAVSAIGAVYQGLHLSEMRLEASKIRIDIGQILKGKPLRPLQTFPVAVRLYWSEADLNASLNTPLLQGAISDFLLSVLTSSNVLGDTLSVSQIDRIVIGEGRLSFQGIFTSDSHSMSGVLYGSLLKASPSQLLFQNPQLQITPETIKLNDFHLDLGSEIAIEKLTLAPGIAICLGRIAVIP
ncbi:MAG: DUF2993 domain-containing protein [Oscillatoria sp. SIO1A7]|nr:DUF2993 domain-containing protein [Oscillatoria sp. SIO1A7]